MSVWRMQIDISFDTKANMLAFMNLIQTLVYRMKKQTPDQGLEIPCKVRWHECMHDVGAPCGNYTTVEFDGTTDMGVPALNAVANSLKTAIKQPLEEEKLVLQGQISTLTAEKEALQAENDTLKAVKPGTGPAVVT